MNAGTSHIFDGKMSQVPMKKMTPGEPSQAALRDGPSAPWPVGWPHRKLGHTGPGQFGLDFSRNHGPWPLPQNLAENPTLEPLFWSLRNFSWETNMFFRGMSQLLLIFLSLVHQGLSTNNAQPEKNANAPNRFERVPHSISVYQSVSFFN